MHPEKRLEVGDLFWCYPTFSYHRSVAHSVGVRPIPDVSLDAYFVILVLQKFK